MGRTVARLPRKAQIFQRACGESGGGCAAHATLRGKNRLRERKYAPEPDRLEGFPVRSFPIEINDVPQEARTLALAFIDYDAIPVGGFCWIHWTACNLPATTTLIPEDASRTGTVDMVQGRNSNWSPMAHGSDNPQVHSRYCGPQPPDATHSYTLNVYALDCELGLPEGFYLNELRRAMSGHVLDQASVELPSRA